MFCTKCGKEIADNVKFCNACGNPVGEVVDNQQSPSSISQSSTQTATQNDPYVNNSASDQAAGVESPATNPPKKRNKVLMVAVIILGALAIVAVTAAIVFALNSTNTKKSSSTLSISDSSIDAKFEQIIKENEQLKAWWDCEYKRLGGSSSSQVYENRSDFNFSLKSLQSLVNYYPNINVTAASPSRYTKIDMNEDDQEELVVMGKNPYGSDVIIGVYYYDNATGNVKMSKVSNSNFADFSDCYTDVICADKTIKSTYSANGGETLSTYKMQGDTVVKTGDYSGFLGKAQNEAELTQAQKQTEDFNNIKNNYNEDKSIVWTNFDSVDPVYTMTGTVKIQTVYERIKDPNTRSTYMKNDRECWEQSSSYNRNEEILLIFENDKEVETPLLSAGGPVITSRIAIAYCLGHDGSVDNSTVNSADYEKLKELKNQKVTITLNMKNAIAPSGLTGWCVDALVDDNSVIDVSEAQDSIQQESQSNTTQDFSEAQEQMLGFWVTPETTSSARIHFIYLKPNGVAENGEIVAHAKEKNSWTIDSISSDGKVNFHITSNSKSIDYTYDPATQVISCPTKTLTSVDDGVTKYPYTMTKTTAPEDYETGIMWNSK